MALRASSANVGASTRRGAARPGALIASTVLLTAVAAVGLSLTALKRTVSVCSLSTTNKHTHNLLFSFPMSLCLISPKFCTTCCSQSCTDPAAQTPFSNSSRLFPLSDLSLTFLTLRICLVLLAGVALPRTRAVASRRAALLVQATAAPARPATPATADVDTTLTPKQLGFTMPGT
jgi:hypothetical protein